ncbi:SusC/RagA family TonB-linked outer membrane protein [Marinoscillum furvescens]|uniref:Iron complex outermembrane receptor protein n=1 Tax=Marinoscillum furvescens DSM 4134 TaxID=1122208 RepID=A0A3D9L5V2_MARFU|nr:SusC/RagA family TonB-linked outer membrane protein [Marinoscillum furvescens]REE01567.1 iron complex outermembrane receptor protein [Marinoscillum furvescens DSM 4134]
MKKYLLLGLSLILSASLWAQERTVSGTVTDADTGEPVPGANVVVKGTTTGTITDFDGNYQLSVGENTTLVFTFVGYAPLEVAVGSRAVVDASLALDISELSEVVVVGYGSQQKKEITSSVVSLDEESFNKGNINDPSQLLQGKVPGLSVYNKGGDPNETSTIRLRGISTVGANTEPLVVIDGVIGASLNNVDPNDIETINVLKDGSAAAIYGSRGSSGVILVTTKSGKRGGGVSASYNTFVSAATVANEQPIMTPSEYIEAGGNDLGSRTDWQDEVTRTGWSNVHNLSVSGGSDKTTFRVSANYRNINGILEKSGFDQINTRASLNHYALNDRLKIGVNMSLTNRESNYSFNEALRYAVLFNPTAPIRNDQGNFFQAILFDNFNPVAILEQNINDGKRKEMNFNANLEYSLTDQLTVNANYGQQYGDDIRGEYYPRTSLFRGFNRGGLARRSVEDSRFTLFETYATYATGFSNVDLSVSAGYSFQEEEREDFYIELGDFPSDALGYYALETSGDRVTGKQLIDVASSATPESRIIAFFGRLNMTIDNGIFLNASIRREGSTKLGKDNQWGIFPAVGAGVDLTRYLDLGTFNVFKFRAGYGVTGSLPNESGLAQDLVEYDFQEGGRARLTRAANPDLKWEEKAEINVGIDFAAAGGKLSGTIDVYNRDISDFILERTVDAAIYETDRRFENAGKLNTKGIEVALNYQVANGSKFSWTPGIVASSYKTVLEEFIIDEQMRANLGAPGQNSTSMVRVAVGEEIGQIWGPVFTGDVEDGSQVLKDVNGDGNLNTAQGNALEDDGDFEQIGKGIPDLEIGWTNQITYGNWDLNAFFRGAFGHSLVNTFRAFYEPIDPGAINSYNRIKSDKQIPEITNAQFSSLYVEKADFFRLDNITLGYNFDMSSSSSFKSVRAYFSVQNAFTITDYSGIDPDPVLQDRGTVDNGGRLEGQPDVLSPGIDRRYNYFTARTFTLGLNVGF